MSIQTFVSEFQDYLFIRRTFLLSLNAADLSASNIELAFKQTEELLEDFKTNIEFLEREGRSIHKELLTMFASLEKKIDKIDRFAEALIGINTTTESSESILTLVPYQFDNSLPNWEHVQKCYMLPPKSSYTTIQPYQSLLEDSSKKGVSKFVIDDTFSTKYIRLSKDFATNINNIVYYNSLREAMSSETLVNNLGQNEVILTIPSSARLVTIEFTYEASSAITLTPLSFYHHSESQIKLEDSKYRCGESLSFSTKTDIPFGCYAQIKVDLVFKDINDTTLLKETSWYPIDNDGNIVLRKKHVRSEEILRVWKEGLFVDVTSKHVLSDEDFVLCKPTYSTAFSPITESSFQTNVKNATTVIVVPTLQLYSLLSQTSTPRVYSITGLSKQ